MLNVCLITLGDPETLTGGYRYHWRMASLASAHGARVEFVSLPRRLPWLWGPRALRAARSADVVLVDSIAAAYVAPWVLRTASGPERSGSRCLLRAEHDLLGRLVAVVHQPPGGIGRSAPRAWLDRMLYRRCELIIVASDTIAASFAHPLVVPPGCDPAGDRSRDLTRYSLQNTGSDLRTALCVANWLPNKGTLELLDAVALLRPGLLRLHLAGDERADSRYGRRVLERVAALGDRVVRHGPCDDAEIARLYRSADMFVLPSYWETYGTVYGEAMAAGLPVIGWRRSGNLPNLITDGKEGIMAEPGDVPALADALHRLAVGEAERAGMAAAAVRTAATFPTWSQSAALFFTALKDLVARDR